MYLSGSGHFTHRDVVLAMGPYGSTTLRYHRTSQNTLRTGLCCLTLCSFKSPRTTKPFEPLKAQSSLSYDFHLGSSLLYLHRYKMYFDLFLPFPFAQLAETSVKGKGKGKGKAQPIAPINVSTSCWTGIEPEEKEAFAKRVALAGHREPDNYRLRQYLS
jgi:hypothetical protein